MKRLLSIAVFGACLAIALLVGVHLANTRATGASASVSPTEVAVVNGVLLVEKFRVTIPWPTYADGTRASASESRWIVSLMEDGPTIEDARPLDEGLFIEMSGLITTRIGYLIIATRSVPPLAVGTRTPPLSFSVSPNPTQHSATIALSLSRRERVEIAVYDVVGRLVKPLVNDELEAGSRTLTWDLRAQDGTAVSSGTYFVKLVRGDETVTKKVVLTR